VKRILQIGSPVLRTPPNPVETFDGRLHAQLKIMRKVMHNAPGVGLAANQIGWFQRAFVWEYEGRSGSVCNPQITERDGEEEEGDERCLSVGWGRLSAKVFRSAALTLAGQDEHGESFEFHADGFLARIFQHEVDHLDGKIFIDRTRGAERARVNELLREASVHV
jgi:peptide deformylase